MSKNKELIIEQVDKLRKIQLPEGWKVAKLDVTFKRDGCTFDDYAEVIYDSMNDVFYAKTAKAIIYPTDVEKTKEAMKIMRLANDVIKGVIS